MRNIQAGFSYLWMLFSVAFIGISSALIIEIGSTAVQRDREKELLSFGRQFRSAIRSYYEIQRSSGEHEYPASLEDLLRDDRVPGIRRHLRKVFIDPMTSKAKWGLIKIDGRIVAIYSLSNKTPIKQDGFETEDIDFQGKQRYSEWLFTYPSNLILAIESD